MSKIYEIYGADAHEMTRKLMTAEEIANIIPPGAKCDHLYAWNAEISLGTGSMTGCWIIC